jgi:3-hydroxybutyryl-CoA dehydrogenase
VTAIEPDRTVAVVGTGTMGQGIAQVALLAGHPVLLYDAVEGRAGQAAKSVAARLDRLVDKGRLGAPARDAALAGLRPVDSLAGLAEAALVVEAVLEDIAVKRELFAALEEVVGDTALLATNTSSLSVTEIAGALRAPGRFVGLHFFNPAPLLPLVEVVSGSATAPGAADRASDTALAWGKTPVRCTDTPGFVVNRVARPFYAEAFRLYEERAADPATVDAVLREGAGFRMGPFELTDLIGQDVNEAVTRSVWESFHHDPKFTPSLAQRRLVQSGRLGRKSGRGWYEYAAGGFDAGRPEPHTAEPCEPPDTVRLRGGLGAAAELVAMTEESGIRVVREAPGDDGTEDCLVLPGGTRLALTEGTTATARGDGAWVLFDLALDYRACTRVALAAGAGADPGDVRAATGLFQRLGKRVSVVDDVPGLVVARTVAMLVDFAADAVGRGVASAEDVDTAMKLGVNYPGGPGEWGERLGARWVHDVLRALDAACPGGRYAPSRALTRRADLERRAVR